MDQVNYTAQKAWKALHFVMRVLRKGKRNTKMFSLHTSLVLRFSNMGLYTGNQAEKDRINALDLVQKRAVQFTNHTKDSDWETLVQRRTIARLCALFKAYSG